MTVSVNPDASYTLPGTLPLSKYEDTILSFFSYGAYT
jgi:hypothetical protein